MRPLALMLVLALAVAAPGQTKPAKTAAPPLPKTKDIIFWTMSRPSVNMLLNHVPQSNALRVAQLRQTFSDLQCRGARLREQPAPGGKNLLCKLPKETAGKYGTILFLANYAQEGRGESAVENWSGALMLPFLYHALAAAPRHHTFLFAEVKGEDGARALFDSLTSSERAAIQGVVALDALGLGPLKYYINPNDSDASFAWTRLQPSLLQAAADQRLPSPVYGIPGAWRRTDVTREFRHHGVPAILIHSVDFAAREVPGSERDTPAAVDREAYFQTITLLADYAVELDRLAAPPAAPRRAGTGRNPLLPR